MAQKGESIVSKLVANLKKKEFRDYLMSTHFWGPVMNWSIPMAAIADFQKDPKIISGSMTLALMCYSASYMRFSTRVEPRNMLLFAVHLVNFLAQSAQAARFINYNYLTSQDKKGM